MTFPGTYIPIGAGSSPAYIHFIDDLLTPRLMSFRMIHIYDEPSRLMPDKINWGTTFGNWLVAAPLIIRKNETVLQTAAITNIDYVNGTYQANPIEIGLDQRPRDTLEVTYQFDYFPPAILEGLLTAAVSIVNMTAVGPPTYYTIDTAPLPWEGIISDIAFAMCMEKLLLDYDLWRYRLVFAISPADLESGGGGDVASQLTTLKQNAEERANTAMQNEKFKIGNYLSPPTRFYYAAIRGLGGSSGAHGIPFLGGKLNGWKPTKFL
jgi:hypothetical protein